MACFSVWRRGSPISQTHSHTSSNKTLQACMHLSKCTHTHTHTHGHSHMHTFYSVELNLGASRDGAVELFMAARLQARP